MYHVLHSPMCIVPTMLTEWLYLTQNGDTPLHIAAMKDLTTCVRLLSTPGIDVIIKNLVSQFIKGNEHCCWTIWCMAGWGWKGLDEEDVLQWLSWSLVYTDRPWGGGGGGIPIPYDDLWPVVKFYSQWNSLKWFFAVGGFNLLQCGTHTPHQPGSWFVIMPMLYLLEVSLFHSTNIPLQSKKSWPRPWPTSRWCGLLWPSSTVSCDLIYKLSSRTCFLGPRSYFFVPRSCPRFCPPCPGSCHCFSLYPSNTNTNFWVLVLDNVFSNYTKQLPATDTAGHILLLALQLCELHVAFLAKCWPCHPYLDNEHKTYWNYHNLKSSSNHPEVHMHTNQ